MYESREMAFLLALVLVVEKGKRQYSVEFEHFVVFRKISPDCVLSWQPINRSLGRQIETQCQDLVKAHHSLGIHDDCEGNLDRWWHGAVPVPTKGCFNRAAPFPSWLQTSISGSRFERVGSLNCSESLK